MSEATRQQKTKDTPRSKAAEILGDTHQEHARKKSESHGGHALGVLSDVGTAAEMALGHGVLAHSMLLASMPHITHDALHEGPLEIGLGIADLVATGADWAKAIPFVKLLRFQVDAFKALANAHAAGAKDAAAMTYANAWVDGILGTNPTGYVMPEHMSARNQGVRDAVSTLIEWGDEREAIRSKLSSELGGGARRALLVEMYSRAGFSGIA